MSRHTKSKEPKIRSVDDTELPPEFKKFDKPLGLEQHVFNGIFIGVIPHACMFYYFLYLWPFGIVPRMSLILGIMISYTFVFGITVGAHRYWTHNTFKANLPMKVIMMLLQTGSGQYPIFKWCRDHRVHHKYVDTDADPHNASRGFWFSHMTWLYQAKHPEVEEKYKIIDISDLARDPVVRFQSKYYWELLLVMFFLIPMALFRWLFPEMSVFHIVVANFSRYTGSLHFTFFVNSIAHIWGDKPYDKFISATENKLAALLTFGEGWHNFHHTFPWDFKAAEFGFKINLSTVFIRCFALIGWAWDLKSVSHKLLVDRVNRTGDGSHPLQNNKETGQNKLLSESDNIPAWGWGDENIRKEDIAVTETLFRSKSN